MTTPSKNESQRPEVTVSPADFQTAAESLVAGIEAGNVPEQLHAAWRRGPTELVREIRELLEAAEQPTATK